MGWEGTQKGTLLHYSPAIKAEKGENSIQGERRRRKKQTGKTSIVFLLFPCHTILLRFVWLVIYSRWRNELRRKIWNIARTEGEAGRDCSWGSVLLRLQRFGGKELQLCKETLGSKPAHKHINGTTVFYHYLCTHTLSYHLTGTSKEEAEKRENGEKLDKRASESSHAIIYPLSGENGMRRDRKRKLVWVWNTEWKQAQRLFNWGLSFATWETTCQCSLRFYHGNRFIAEHTHSVSGAN